MKIREWMKKRTGRKGYAAAGILCLAAAILALSFGPGLWTQAEALPMGSDGEMMDFTVEADGSFAVDSEMQLKALGSATAAQTEGKTFVLTEDIEMKEIDSAAVGTFAGILDGQGHVIAIQEISIHDSTTDPSEGVSQGVLFGTVSGTIQNLIVDVQDEEASYTRTSDAGVEQDGTPTVRTTDAAPRYQLNLNETVSELDGEGTDTAKYDAYLDLQYGKNYTEVYLDENMTEVEEGTPGAVKYKKYESNAEVSTETAYQAAGSSVEDSFGILCGTLAENGRILQVSLNGSEVRVEQTGKEHSASVAQVDRTPHYYYYEIGQMDKVEAADVETDPVSLGVMKDDPGESSEEAANATVSQILRLSAAVPGGVLADERGNYSIRYRLTVSPEAGGTLENVTIAINGLEAESVSWSGGGTTGSGESFSLGEVIADTEVICTVTGNLGSSGDEIEKNLGFTAKADVGEQTVAAKVENVGTTIRSGAAIDADIKVENPDVREGVLNLSVSAEEGKPNDGKATITYTVTVQNNSTRILEGVTVAYPSDATYSGDLSEETVGDDNTVTRSDTLNGDRNWTVKFTREVREGDDTSASFRAWATLSTGGAQQTVSTGSVTSTANITGPSQESGTEALRKGASTGNVRNAAAASKAPGDSGALAGGTLILTVQNPKNAIRGEQIEYDLTLTAPAGQQVTLTSDQELYWDGMGTSYTYTVIGTGEAQEIQAAITAPADGDEFTCRFSAKTDGGYATSVAETKTGLLDGREISDSGSNESIAGRGLLLEVSAAQEAAGTSGDAQIVYTVQTTVPNLTGTLTLQALDENGSPVSGTWTNETSTTEGDAYETPGTSRTSIVKFTRTVSDPEGLTEKIGTSFRAVYTQTNGNVLTARTEKLETTVYRSSVSLQDADDALEVSLTRTGTNSFTLTLTNSGTGPVAIKKDCLTGWDLATENGWLEESYEVNSGTSYKGGIFSEDAGYYILAGTASESAQKTVTLTRSVAEPAEDPVTVTITGVRLTVTKIATYTYRKETTGRPTGAPVESGTVRSAIDLAAGALAGKTEAGSSIEACRQEIHLTGATTTDNDAKLTLGGISGRSDGSDYKDLYVKGSVSGGSDGAKGLVSGAAADTALTYAVVAEAAELEDLGAGLTLEAGTLRLGSDGAPEESWDAWTSFELYDKADADKSETAFDLGWLVKKREAGDEGLFDYNNPSATSASPKVTVSLHSGAAVTKQPLDFTVVYRARKMLADSIYTQYISGLEEKNTFDLEASGYYQLVSAYATDGYYHYVQSYGTTGDDGTVSYTTVYPYTTERPVFYDETEGATPWSVEREDTGLEDQIVLQLTPNGWTVNDLKVWYGEEGGKPAEISDSKARFEFQEEAVIITAVPELNEKIYEEFTSPEFTSKDREPLPGPTLTDENYYDAEGNTVTSEWSKTNSYESGGSLTMTERASGCDYTYQFSEESPMTEEGSIWTTAGDGVWRTTDTVGAGLSEGWESVGSDFKIPIPEVTEDSVKYLYILVSRENYPDTVYCYGPVNIVPAASGEPQFYYNYYQNDAGDWEGDPIEDNDPIVAGDTLVINVKASDNLKTAEYRLAENELPQSELADTERWTEYTEPVAIEKEGEWAACYLYVRLRSGSPESELPESESPEPEFQYGEVKEYFYQFGGTAMKAEVAPGTNEVMNDDDRIAFSTASGTTVTMSSADEDAKLLYVVSETYVTPARLTVSRVTGDISGLEDGASGRYFKIGNRWYETDKEAKVFQEGDLKLFNNDSDRNIEMYVGTVALVEDKEPSEQIIYGYEVQPAQQVSDPEAAIVTQSNPDGGNVASAVVEKGAYISFRSQTPGAELYYIIGSSDQVQDHEDETTGTKFYNDTTGILVDGDYGSQFYVSIKAVKRDEAGDKSMKDSRIICFIYTIAEQKQVLAPTATPSTQDDDPTVMTPGDKILLSSSTRGAAIYYTTDGSAPSAVMNEDGTVTVEGTTQLYDASEGILMPEEGEGYFTVRAIAVAEELKNSSEGKFVYAFPDPVQSPYATVPSGSVDLGQEIILKNRTDGATIYYTISTSGTEPADPTLSSSVFTEEQPIVISGRTVVKAIAMKNGAKSPVITLTYDTKDQLSPPEASIASGSMVPRGARLTLDAESGASVYYTIDGSDPSDASNSSAAMGRELILDGKAGDLVTVKAYARKEGKSASEVVTFTYQISQSAGGVTADVESGSSVSAGSKINLLTDVTGAEIYYTTDGTSPADHGVRGAVVTVSGTPGSVFTIKAVARVDGESGTVCTFTYKIKERPSAPTASPAGGVLTVATRVELSSPAEKIYYTTDGTTPTESSSLYKEAVLINRTTQLRAIAVSEDGEVSEVATFQYTAASRAGRPEASIADGSVVEPGTQVLLQTETSGAVIYYSTDGTEPTLDNLDQMLEYTEGITLNRTVTVKAAAYREDLQLSEVGTFSYVVETIPAVEQKKAEEARLEAEQLHATDASGLTRNTDGDDFDKERTLQEKDYHTTVSGTEEAIPEDTVLVTEKETYETRALENVRQLFGEEYTILDSYNMYLMRGGSIVQPDGQVEIGIPIPDRYENAAVTIVYIDGNNRITRQQTRREGGMAYAYTDHFSNYALVGLEEIGEGGFSIPYLLILEILAGLCALAGAIYFIRKKWKKNR